MAPVAGIIMLGLTAAGTAMSAVGAVRSAQAQQGAADYNAKIAEQNAEAARAQGVAAAQAQQRDFTRRQGSAIALYGASGVTSATGSPSDVLADSMREATLDNLTTQYNYNLRALGYSNQSGLDRAQGKNAMSAGWMNMTSSILNGASKFAEQASEIDWGN